MTLDADHPHAVPGLADLVFATRNLGAANGRLRVTVARYLGISVGDVVALIHLHAFGPLSQRELADGLGITPSAVTVMLDRLEPHGIVRRVPDPDDRRRTLIEIYADREDPMGIYRVISSPFLALDEDDRAEATRLLLRLQDIVTESARALSALPPLPPVPPDHPRPPLTTPLTPEGSTGPTA